MQEETGQFMLSPVQGSLNFKLDMNVRQQSILIDLVVYINAHLRERLTLNALARHACFCPSYLSRIFRKKFHMTRFQLELSQPVRLYHDFSRSSTFPFGQFLLLRKKPQFLKHFHIGGIEFNEPPFLARQPGLLGAP